MPTAADICAGCVRCTPDAVSCVAQQHRFTYNEPMPVESCTQSLCDLALRFGEDDEDGGMVRPAPMFTLALARVPMEFSNCAEGALLFFPASSSASQPGDVCI